MTAKELKLIIDNASFIKENLKLLPKGAEKELDRFMTSVHKLEVVSNLVKQSLLNDTDAAQYIGVTKGELKALIETGNLKPAQVVGKKPLFYINDVNAFMQKEGRAIQATEEKNILDKELESLFPLLNLYIEHVNLKKELARLKK